MKFVLRMALSAALAIGIASTASAQRPGGGAGFGGGFGISAYSLVSTNKALQDELKITDDQKKKLEEALKPIAEKRREAFAGGFGQNQTDEQRKERAEKMAKLTEETKAAVEGALDEKQKTRLSEINLQVQGFAAYSDKAVQEKLKLTDAQKEKIKGIAETYAKDRQELAKDAPRGGRGQGGQQPSEEDQKKMAEYRKKTEALRGEAEDKVKAELTAEQKETWKKLVGEKFDTTKLQQGFGGGQGGNRNRNRPNN